jgi:putative hydrolase
VSGNNDNFDDDSNANNPFGGLFGGGAMFGDIMKMFSQQGPIHWDTARQIATMTATNGQAESNVDPAIRIGFNDLARIAAQQVHQVTGLGDPAQVLSLEPLYVTPGEWCRRTLDDYQPLFNDLASALSSPTNTVEDLSDATSSVDPFSTFFASITNMVAPMTMGMTIGSMVGLLAKKSFGQYDLPLPRPTDRGLLIVPTNVDSFAANWDLDQDEVRMWTLIRELVIHSVYGLDHFRNAVESQVREFVGAFQPDPQAIADRLTNLDSGDPQEMMGSLQRLLSDPELLLGAVRSPKQERLQPQLDAILGLVIGWSDHMTDTVGSMILGNPSRIAEAVRRRRVQTGDETVFVEKLLGLHINRQQVERGRSFVSGVLERSGNDGLRELYRGEEFLPTAAELDAPGLWLARIEITKGA